MPYVMQAASSVDGQIYTWIADAPDFAGDDYPGDGSPVDLVVASKPGSAGEAVAVTDDIAKVGETIARVHGFNGTSLETTDTPGTGEVWKKRGTKFRTAKPVGLNEYDPADYGTVDATGSVTSHVAINAAIAAANLTGGVVTLGEGDFRMDQAFTPLGPGVKLRGVRRNAPTGGSGKGTRVLSYVSTGLSLLSLGVTGHMGTAAEHITFEQRTDTATDYETASVFDFAKFRTLGFAAIEAGTIGYATIDHCSFHGFPVGIILDGAEEVIVNHCIFSGGSYNLGTGGYSDYDDHGVGIWLTRGPSRDNGNPYDGITNVDTLRNCNFYGGQYGIWAEDGVQNTIENCRFHAGGGSGTDAGIVIGTVTNLTIDGAYYEGGTYARYILREDLVTTSIANNVTISNTVMLGSSQCMHLEDATYGLTIFGCAFGGPNAGYCITGLNNVVGFSIDGVTVSGSVADFASHPGDFACGISQIGGPTYYGVGVNKAINAQAAIDIRQVSTSKPTIRTHGTYAYFTHENPSAQKHVLSYFSTNPESGLAGGKFTVTDTWHFEVGGAAKDLAAFAVPANANLDVRVRVMQRQATDPSKYQYTHKQQRVYKAGGGIVFQGTFDDVASSGPDQTVDTDGSFTDPTLIDDGAGNIVVHCASHPSAFSQVQVDVEILMVRG
jgi:hypothetical protein